MVWALRLLSLSIGGLGLGLIAILTGVLPMGAPFDALPQLSFAAVAICLVCFGIGLWPRHRRAGRAHIPLSRQPGGKILLGYEISSFVFLRLFGLGYLTMAYGVVGGYLDLSGLMSRMGGDPALWASLFAGIGLVLLLPPLTPKFLRRPESVSRGVCKALVLIILIAPLYLAGQAVLESGIIAHGAKLQAIVPLLFKSIAGLSVTGAVLISMATQLSMDEQSVQPTRPRLSDADLKRLRKARMGS